MYDFMVVGAGFFGATFARRVTDLGRSCLVVDKLPHVAGAAYDKKIGRLNISQYGAHVFHTSNQSVWDWVNRFGKWEEFVYRPKVKTQGRVFSFPINLMTLHQLWGVTTPDEAEKTLNNVRLRHLSPAGPRNFEEWALSQVGEELYRLFIYGYTKKQYGKEPRELPASIIRRLPIRLTYDDNYFVTDHQAVPRDGYTSIITNMLDGIKVELLTPMPIDWKKYAKHLIYTGCVDVLMGCAIGRLDYSSMKFDHKTLRGDFQGNAAINYTDLSVPYLRSIEHKHFLRDKRKHHGEIYDEPTVVTFDYPSQDGEPYYPIRDEKNSELYAKYATAATDNGNVTLGGRLGEYRYYDMDQAVASALQKADKLCQERA